MLFSELVEGEVILSRGGNLEVPVLGITCDSRQVKEGYIFVAIEGLVTDGHYFIDQAISNGAVALVVQKYVAVSPPVAWIQVSNTRLALASLSAGIYGHPSRKLKLIGVTGTNGKTTTTYLLRAIYQSAGHNVGIIGTIANWIGDKRLPVHHTTPESCDLQKLLAGMVHEGIDTVVMEVSSHALSLHRVAQCHFNTGIFTNITRDHLDFHQNMDNYLAAKKILFEMAREFVVINNDFPDAAREIKTVSRAKAITYGIKHEADLTASDIEVSRKGTSFYVRTPWGATRLKSKLSGHFNIYNCLASLAAGGAHGLPLSLMVQALENVTGVPGRFELVDRGQDFTVIIDYAHTPDGLENVLKTSRQLTSGRIITVFGCGGDRDRSKRPLMGEIAARYSDIPIVTSDNPRTENPLQIIADIERGIRKLRALDEYIVLPDRREAINYAIQSASRGDVVVIAGKGHEDYQIIGDKKLPFNDRAEAIKALEKGK